MAGLNSWDANRKSNGWGSGLVEWVEDNTTYLSIVFSWLLPKAYQRAAWYKAQGYTVLAGGPAVMFRPGYFANVAIEQWALDPNDPRRPQDVIARHNPYATFTSRGCIRKCSFCAVPKIEGKLVAFRDWPVRSIICDNNLLACSKEHFDRVIDRLKSLSGIDFNQGLDARLLTLYHARRIAELDLRAVRLAWDHTAMERKFMAAFGKLRKAGIPASLIHVYVLMGWNDTPDDALYRLQTVANLGAYPNPMRYQPLGSLTRNAYVVPGWTDAELKRYMRYWANLRITRNVPFAKFKYRGEEPDKPVSDQQPTFPDFAKLAGKGLDKSG